ncbi:MAG: gluconate 2-dehydrogenase subunit 3 family protein [Acidobacteriota bacterium]|nr:gluconate 2-dehydrogenase subunit 3 family protein [Acidobacteriota bacterium]
MAGAMKRRDLMKLFPAIAFSTPLLLAAPEPGAPLYFTKDQFLLLDTLTELIIPADDHSPGAHGAGVAVYIDKSVAEAFAPEDKTSWQKGLAAVNQLCQSMHGKPFLRATKEQQIAVLQKMSSSDGEQNGGQAEGDSGKRGAARHRRFFEQLKDTTAAAYYSSSIGIHQEIEYKGNVILEEFAGYMPDAPLPPISSLSAA